MGRSLEYYSQGGAKYSRSTSLPTLCPVKVEEVTQFSNIRGFGTRRQAVVMQYCTTK